LADATKAQSRKVWREEGYNVENAEFFVDIGGGRKVKRDLFGFVDLVAIPKPADAGGSRFELWPDEIERGRLMGWPTIFIQVTSWAHVPTRVRKILTETTGKGQWETPLRALADGLRAGGALILVEGWRKRKDEVSGRLLWQRRQHWFTEEELRP